MTSSTDADLIAGRRPRDTGVVAALLIAVFAFSVLQTVVVPVLPDLRRAFGVGPTEIAWVLSAFLLTSSVGTVLIGRLGDQFGKRRLIMISLAVLAVGTLLVALAPNFGTAIAGRAVQGLGAATFPLAFGIVRDQLPPERVPITIGTISAIFGIGFGIGLIVPGPILDRAGWPWVFWLSLALVIIALVAVFLLVPESATRSPGRIDLLGGALLTAGLVALLLGISQVRAWGPVPAVALLIVAIAVLAAFWAVQRRVSQPMIDVSLLRSRTVAGADLSALIFGFSMYGAFTLVPQLVQTPAGHGFGFGASATGAGLFVLPMAITMVIAGPLAGKLGPRVGFRAILIIACAVAGTGFVVLAAAHPWAPAVLLGSGVVGVGIGFAFAAMANLVISAVGRDRVGESTGINAIMRTIGGAIGAQTAGLIITALGDGDGPTAAGYSVAFTVSAAALGLALITALLVERESR
ncbi:MFS transporter [Microlunatus sp. GCM10028923]|uniref:MFS transporter n=1 Tax=Microlunatus sp. GCM10028923 TaxID=3273400 RepID=UPI00361CE5B9